MSDRNTLLDSEFKDEQVVATGASTSAPIESKPDLWRWEEPEPVSDQEARDINSNAFVSINGETKFVPLEGARFVGLTDFVNSLYTEGQILFETDEDLVRYLQCLRAVSKKIGEIRVKRKTFDFLPEAASATLDMVLGSISEDEEFMDKLDRLMQTR